MIPRRYLFVCCLSAAAVSGLAEGAAAGSIFSFNGLGYPVRRVDPRSEGMGGAGRAFVDGLNYSGSNPALLASFRLSGLSATFQAQRRRVKDAAGPSRTIADGDLGQIQMVLPLRGTVVGVGIEPMTDVDFAVVDTLSVSVPPYELAVAGAGGVQMVSLGVGRRVGRRLYAGVRLGFLMGTINETWEKTLSVDAGYGPTNSEQGVDLISRFHRGWLPEFGAILTLGNFSLATALSPPVSFDQRIVHTNRIGIRTERTDALDWPWRVGGGVAYARTEKWMFAADVEAAGWASTGPGRHDTFEAAAGVLYRTGDDDPVFPRRRHDISAGAFWRSLYFATSSSDPVVEKGASLGLSFPFKARSGVFRYVIEGGTRGDRDLHGASEFFLRQTFAISGWLRSPSPSPPLYIGPRAARFPTSGFLSLSLAKGVPCPDCASTRSSAAGS